MSKPPNYARSKTERVYLDNETQVGYSVDAHEEFTKSYEKDDLDGNRGEWVWSSDGVTIEKWYFDNGVFVCEISESDIPQNIIDKMDDILSEHEFEPIGGD